MRRLATIVLTAALAALAAGCGGSSSKHVTSKGRAHVAKTPNQYAERVVEIVLVPLNKDLRIVNALNLPDIRIYLLNGEKDTVRILNRTAHELHGCTGKLDRVGAPPEGHPELDRIEARLDAACVQYAKIADVLIDTVPLISSGDQDQAEKGLRAFRAVYAPSKLAARELGAAVALMQKNAAFRRAGVQGSS